MCLAYIYNRLFLHRHTAAQEKLDIHKSEVEMLMTIVIFTASRRVPGRSRYVGDRTS